MALISCSECQGQVSDRAAACPHCGAPVVRAGAALQVPAHLRAGKRGEIRRGTGWFWVLAFFGVVGGLGALVGVPSGRNAPASQAVIEADVKRFTQELIASGNYGAVLKSQPGSFRINQLILTVPQSWHSEPYSIRLQAAQSLWALWAKIRSPKNPDKARIKIVDVGGNEVGGSRIWGGSLIWVQEN